VRQALTDIKYLLADRVYEVDSDDSDAKDTPSWEEEDNTIIQCIDDCLEEIRPHIKPRKRARISDVSVNYVIIKLD